MKKTVLNSFCQIFKNNQSTKDAFFLHGFNSSIKEQQFVAEQFAIDNPDYNVIQCQARGHGNRKYSSKLDWKGTIDDINSVIQRDTVLIGHSMGGTMALTIGLMNPKVKKVFAVSAIHGDAKIVKERIGLVEKLLKINNQDLVSELSKVESGLPANFETCSPSNKEKYYLIHATNDGLVPFSEFEANQKDLCIPDENTLIFDKYMSLTFGGHSLSHILPFYDKKTKQFIENHLK